jgi:hypothetical protein
VTQRIRRILFHRPEDCCFVSRFADGRALRACRPSCFCSAILFATFDLSRSVLTHQIYPVYTYTMTRGATSFRGGRYARDRCGKTFSVPDAQDCSFYFLTWHSCAACRQYKQGSQQSGSLYLYWPCLSAFLTLTQGRDESRPYAWFCYFSTLMHLPAPTVRPPSRMAKETPTSMATGWISSTCISMLSPGITISTPSGSLMAPVTSVVRT